ncbi:hypothetical protein [Paenibacillus sp. WLX2291]|uniref:hypothetical protein n=1 Tax=Paenibacillus sp. WLX2291 TaxID=3296934 RepID=UPI0039840FFC
MKNEKNTMYDYLHTHLNVTNPKRSQIMMGDFEVLLPACVISDLITKRMNEGKDAMFILLKKEMRQRMKPMPTRQHLLIGIYRGGEWFTQAQTYANPQRMEEKLHAYRRLKEAIERTIIEIKVGDFVPGEEMKEENIQPYQEKFTRARWIFQHSEIQFKNLNSTHKNIGVTLHK